MIDTNPNTTESGPIPQRIARSKHLRRAYHFGHANGQQSGRMADPEELEYPAAERGLLESIESGDWERVGHWYASNSRDIGVVRGLRTLEHIEEIAKDGVAIPHFCTNGDTLGTARTASESGYYSLLTDGSNGHLTDETIDAYDEGFAAGFAHEMERSERAE